MNMNKKYTIALMAVLLSAMAATPILYSTYVGTHTITITVLCSKCHSIEALEQSSSNTSYSGHRTMNCLSCHMGGAVMTYNYTKGPSGTTTFQAGDTFVIQNNTKVTFMNASSSILATKVSLGTVGTRIVYDNGTQVDYSAHRWKIITIGFGGSGASKAQGVTFITTNNTATTYSNAAGNIWLCAVQNASWVTLTKPYTTNINLPQYTLLYIKTSTTGLASTSYSLNTASQNALTYALATGIGNASGPGISLQVYGGQFHAMKYTNSSFLLCNCHSNYAAEWVQGVHYNFYNATSGKLMTVECWMCHSLYKPAYQVPYINTATNPPSGNYTH
jgi:hypothetical protein